MTSTSVNPTSAATEVIISLSNRLYSSRRLTCRATSSPPLPICLEIVMTAIVHLRYASAIAIPSVPNQCTRAHRPQSLPANGSFRLCASIWENKMPVFHPHYITE